MSRGQAKRELDIGTLKTQMAGITWNAGPGTRPGNAVALLDEDPRAYKNIDEVMAAQADLVTVDHTLRQVLNYKGA